MASTKWAIDPSHSEIQFKVKHLMITTVTGTFGTFEGGAETQGDDFTNASISFSADMDTISTGSADRDNHLKSADFFEAGVYPKLSFESTRFEPQGDDYILEGNLTIKDVTKPVKLQVEFAGTNTDPWGNTKAGFALSGKISRAEWGLNWNAALETGGVLVSDDVRIAAEIQLVKTA